MADKPVRNFGPVLMTTTLTTSIYTTGVGVFDLIRMIWICNRTASAATLSLWLGAPGGNVAGTEIVTGLSIPGNSVVPYYFSPGLKVGPFNESIVGGSNTASALVLIAMGYQAAS